MKTTVTVPLPISAAGFGGIVGSRVQAASPGKTNIQIAYLEKGKLSRVRFIESTLDAWGDPLNISRITPQEEGENVLLFIEIELGEEKWRTDWK